MRIDRRDLLRMGMFAGVGLVTQSNGASEVSRNDVQEVAKPKVLTPYVDALIMPAVIRPTVSPDTVLKIDTREIHHKVHRDLAPTRMWGYAGRWPGPTIEVRRGQSLHIKWSNGLPRRHFLPVDTSIHGAEASAPEVRTVVHVHGAQVLPENDGYPDSWLAPDGKTGPTYESELNHYPNDQAATSLWYHDHALGITRLNVMAGLAGIYLIRDDEEDALNLPRGPYEIPLLIQDRSFLADGSLWYPAAQNGTHPMWMQEFFGETICVNGKAAPYLEVEPRKYRFRLVNGSNSRFYDLKLLPSDRSGKPSGQPENAPAFRQIGADAGLLPAPLTSHSLVLSPGERFDVVIDFGEHEGRHFAMTNSAAAPYAGGGEVVPTEVMLFSVTKPLSGKDTSTLPERLVPMDQWNPRQAVRERLLSLTEIDRPSDGYTMIGLLGGKHWNDPITEDPVAGSIEIWSFVNTTEDAHPIHVHLVKFQVLNRQPFEVKQYLEHGKLFFTGEAFPPEPNERPAWKDTVKSDAGYVTRVIAKFDLPAGTKASPGQEFRYVWHCHMLEHEDNQMMRPFKVIG